MRKPKVDNKYNLTMAKIRKLKIADRSQIGKPLFWRNDVIGAWCIILNIDRICAVIEWCWMN